MKLDMFEQSRELLSHFSIDLTLEMQAAYETKLLESKMLVQSYVQVVEECVAMRANYASMTFIEEGNMDAKMYSHAQITNDITAHQMKKGHYYAGKKMIRNEWLSNDLRPIL